MGRVVAIRWPPSVIADRSSLQRQTDVTSVVKMAISIPKLASQAFIFHAKKHEILLASRL
jgi:hypothetical protein